MTGSRTLSVTGADPGIPLSINSGTTLNITETGNRTNLLSGTVTSYSAGTLVMNITSGSGTCNTSTPLSPKRNTCKRWLISTVPSTILIPNSSSGALFDITENASVDTTVTGIHFQQGTGTNGAITVHSGAGKAVLIHDNYFEQDLSLTTDGMITMKVNRGVIYRNSFESSGFSTAPYAIFFLPQDDTVWFHASYLGNADDGTHNTYVEDNDFHCYLNIGDNSEGSRSVLRYNLFNNAGFTTHGVDTGFIGQRHFEIYANRGVFNGYADGSTFPMAWWWFVRGGTFVITNNNYDAISSTDYTQADLNMTEMALGRNAGPPYTACWAQGTTNGANWPAPHQVGMGYITGTGLDGKGNHTYDASGNPAFSTMEYVGDPEPAWVWGNTRSPLTVSITSYGSTDTNHCVVPPPVDVSPNYIKSGRDYFNSIAAKPGYIPFTYPHPLVVTSSNTINGQVTISGSVQIQ